MEGGKQFGLVLGKYRDGNDTRRTQDQVLLDKAPTVFLAHKILQQFELANLLFE